MRPSDVRTLQTYVAYWLGGRPEDVAVDLSLDHGRSHLAVTHPGLGGGPAACTRVYSSLYSGDSLEVALDSVRDIGLARRATRTAA